MKHHLLMTTATGAALAMSAPALADNYVSLFGGTSFLDDTSDHIFGSSGTFGSSTTGTTGRTLVSSGPVTFGSYSGVHYAFQFNQLTTVTNGSFFYGVDVDIAADTGFVIGAAMGKDLTNGWSVEVEAAHRKHNVDVDVMIYLSSSFTTGSYSQLMQSSFTHITNVSSLATATVSVSSTVGFTVTAVGSVAFASTGGVGGYSTTTSQSGDFTAFSIMANAWFDLGQGVGGMQPYVGGGIGWAKVDFEVGSMEADDSGLAYQFGAGVGWDMGSGRMNLEYRYFAVPDLSFDLGGGASFDGDYNASEIIVGWKMPM
ncbi:MAG: porin family protein [Alphaproteobacteria bacterium]|nr:MAG: porin family protein [Alphaproteobacteria bacterium]